MGFRPSSCHPHSIPSSCCLNIPPHVCYYLLLILKHLKHVNTICICLCKSFQVFKILRFGEILITLTFLIYEAVSHVMQIRTFCHFKFFMCIVNIWPKSEKTAVKFLNIIDDANHCNCLSWDFEHRNLSQMLFTSPLSYLCQQRIILGTQFWLLQYIYTLRLSCSILGSIRMMTFKTSVWGVGLINLTGKHTSFSVRWYLCYCQYLLIMLKSWYFTPFLPGHNVTCLSSSREFLEEPSSAA